MNVFSSLVQVAFGCGDGVWSIFGEQFGAKAVSIVIFLARPKI
jgi:hypothetical protein